MGERYLIITERLHRENSELKEENERLRKELDDKDSKINELQEEINDNWQSPFRHPFPPLHRLPEVSHEFAREQDCNALE